MNRVLSVCLFATGVGICLGLASAFAGEWLFCAGLILAHLSAGVAAMALAIHTWRNP